MASRSHVDVNERRLRPIYDCLDNGNNRKAIQEADKVLKKQKDFQCAKVLRALALLRLGRQDESAVLLQEVHTQNPTDDATLQAMSICYREVHKLEAIAELYENAHKARLDNEEILSALFMAHVRLSNYKKQQQTAMALHKLRPQKNPYYFWAVMSNIMQAHSSPDPKLAKTMYLPLAERMTKKYVDEGKIDAEAEVLLYLMVLELQEKWQEAIDLLQGPLGERVVSELNMRSTKLAELHCKLQNWSKANAIFRKLLKENPDHWQFWLSYLDTSFRLIDSGYTPPTEKGEGDGDEGEGEDKVEDKVDSSLEEVMEFINERIKGCQETTPLRGPYLAQMELVRIMRERKSELLKLAGPPSELFQQYYDLFGTKPCCATDLKAYVCLLTPEELQTLLDKFEESSKLTTDNGTPVFADDVKHICKHITILQLSRLAEVYGKRTTEDLLQVSGDLVLRYRKGLDFGKDLLQTDIQPSDPYLLLAAHLLVDLWQRTGQERYLWQVVVQLELGIRRSPANHQFKLLLMRLYAEMGAFGPCPALWNGMDMKHIMNDSLGYFISNHVGRLGHFVAACAMFGTMLRFFSVNHKETTEYLLASYKYGSFGKIREFVDFRDKLQRSFQYKSASTERLLLDLILETNCHASTEQMLSYIEVDPSKERAILSEVSDNRDFTAMDCWDPPSQFRIADYKTESFNEEKAWLHSRDLILRILVAAVMSGQDKEREGKDDASHNGESLTNGSTDESGKGNMAGVVRDLLPRFIQHMESCAKEFSDPKKYPVQGPYRTRITTYLQGNHHQLLVRLVQCFLKVHHLHENGLKNPENKDGEILDSPITDLLEGLTEGSKRTLVKEEDGHACINVSLLEHLIMSAESLSFATTLMGVCSHLLRPLKTSWSKQSRKKKGQNAPQPAVFDKFTALVAELQETAKSLHQVATQFDPVFMALDLSALSLTETLTNTEEESQCEKAVWSKVERSFQQSSHEVCELLHNKLQYLHTCRV
ncbi:N-alpha-acetyltransferase 25, NatB auxiliary subunit-like [Littorina saxatilis]|uniref:N-terminal acetyltransferase B complex subunit NAA25 homolog n=1 Tax=Littorina saxatilis TaxID=31220 RepID=A0AAN9AJJ6_9CAEN